MSDIMNVKFEYDSTDELDAIIDTIEQIEYLVADRITPKKRNKRNQIQFRLSDENYCIFLKRIQLSGLSKTEFLTRACTSQKIHCVSGSDVNNKLESLSYEVNRYGNNLNQIARRLNERDYKDAGNNLFNLNNSFEKLINEFVNVRKEINKL